LVTCVVLPSRLTLKSLKVVVFMEEAIIFSEKVAVRLAEGATPVAPALGTVLMTLVSHSAARQPVPEQFLKALS
jgi:hypothetical protein